MGIAPDKKGGWEDLETPAEAAAVVATETEEVKAPEFDENSTVE